MRDYWVPNDTLSFTTGSSFPRSRRVHIGYSLRIPRVLVAVVELPTLLSFETPSMKLGRDASIYLCNTSSLVLTLQVVSSCQNEAPLRIVKQHNAA
jgi:hypothetical protein